MFGIFFFPHPPEVDISAVFGAETMTAAKGEDISWVIETKPKRKKKVG